MMAFQVRVQQGCTGSLRSLRAPLRMCQQTAAVNIDPAANVDPDANFRPPIGRGNEDDAAEKLADFISRCKGVSVLTGAGMSTASGIPDYRSPNGAYSKGYKPTTHQQFMKSHAVRQRYWARSMAGYKTFASRKPNRGHFALADMETSGMVHSIITQNVDGLHGIAGSTDVIELHGRGRVVKCTNCGHERPRHEYEAEMLQLNLLWAEKAAEKDRLSRSGRPDVRPDGDANVERDFSKFEVLPCTNCKTGIMKPDVVFFGDNIPRERRDRAHDAVRNSNGLLIAGTSVHVYSAYSLVLTAAKNSVPIAIVNIGETRADIQGLEGLRLHERCEAILPLTRDLLP